jgi:hypothetical protein
MTVLVVVTSTVLVTVTSGPEAVVVGTVDPQVDEVGTGIESELLAVSVGMGFAGYVGTG